MDRNGVQAQTVMSSTPSVSRWHGHGHAVPGGRAGLALGRLPVVLSGNAQTPRVADRGPGRAETWRAVPHEVGRRVRTPGTQCRRARHRPGRGGADVRRHTRYTHFSGRSRTQLARPAGTPRRAGLAGSGRGVVLHRHRLGPEAPRHRRRRRALRYHAAPGRRRLPRAAAFMAGHD